MPATLFSPSPRNHLQNGSVREIYYMGLIISAVVLCINGKYTSLICNFSLIFSIDLTYITRQLVKNYYSAGKKCFHLKVIVTFPSDTDDRMNTRCSWGYEVWRHAQLPLRSILEDNLAPSRNTFEYGIGLLWLWYY